MVEGEEGRGGERRGKRRESRGKWIGRKRKENRGGAGEGESATRRDGWTKVGKKKFRSNVLTIILHTFLKSVSTYVSCV